MEQPPQSSRFAHKLIMLQQESRKEKKTFKTYQNQLTELIEEEVRSEELNRQSRLRAQLWEQAKNDWKLLEEEQEKQQEKERQRLAEELRAEQQRFRQIEEQKKELARRESEQAMQPYTDYRDIEVPTAMQEMQNRAKRNRGASNFFQLLIITTSTVAAGIVNITTIPRLVTSFLTIIVAIATGVVWIFKFKERSINSQQTADSIEYQRNLYRLGIKDYAGKDPKEAHEIFATRVEDLKNEQNKRQQLLEQTSDKTMEGGGSLKTT